MYGSTRGEGRRSTGWRRDAFVAGDGAVGKTALIRRYCEGKFEASRVLTIGVNFQTRLVELPGGVVKLSIWDMAGQARFESLRGGFYRGARAAALVYAIDDADSFAHLTRWRDEILKVAPGQRFLLVGNKADLAGDRAVSIEDAANFARTLNAPFVETSALTADGVTEMFSALGGSAARR